MQNGENDYSDVINVLFGVGKMLIIYIISFLFIVYVIYIINKYSTYNSENASCCDVRRKGFVLARGAKG